MRERLRDAADTARPGPRLGVSARGWLAATAAWWIDDRRWWHALAALLYVAAALVFTYPLLLVAGTHITYKPSGDQLFLLSILEWSRTALFSKPGEFFVGNFYFGAGGALFGSDLLLGFLPIYGPLAWITQSPVLAYSITHIAAFALNAGAMYATVLVLTRSRSGALLAGAVYAFGPLQLAYANHFQFLGAWYLPLVLLFGIRLWRGGGWLDFGLATLMVWAQFATAVHLGVIAAMVYAAFVVPPTIHRVVTTRDARLGLAMLAAGIVASAPFAPVVHGYLSFCRTLAGGPRYHGSSGLVGTATRLPVAEWTPAVVRDADGRISSAERRTTGIPRFRTAAHSRRWRGGRAAGMDPQAPGVANGQRSAPGAGRDSGAVLARNALEAA